MKRLGDVQRRANVQLTGDQQRRDIDGGQDVSQITFGECPEHRPHARWMYVTHDGQLLLDQIRRCRVCQQALQISLNELLRRQFGLSEPALQPVYVYPIPAFEVMLPSPS